MHTDAANQSITIVSSLPQVFSQRYIRAANASAAIHSKPNIGTNAVRNERSLGTHAVSGDSVGIARHRLHTSVGASRDRRDALTRCMSVGASASVRFKPDIGTNAVNSNDHVHRGLGGLRVCAPPLPMESRSHTQHSGIRTCSIIYVLLSRPSELRGIRVALRLVVCQ